MAKSQYIDANWNSDLCRVSGDIKEMKVGKKLGCLK